MPQVEVRFAGLCTHFPVLIPNHWHVVLADASDPVALGAKDPRFVGIMPHLAQLQLLKAEVVGTLSPPFYASATQWLLDMKGAELAIGNAALGPPVNQTGPCLPNLSTWKFPIAESAVATDPSLAACHFDFQSGTIDGISAPKGACMARVTVDTLGDRPQLVVKQGGITKVVTLVNHAKIEVINSPSMPGGGMEHFLLHYLTADGFPGVTPMVSDCTCPEHVGECWAPLENPACSNAQLP